MKRLAFCLLLFFSIFILSCQSEESGQSSSTTKGSVLDEKEDTPVSEDSKDGNFISSTSKYNYDDEIKVEKSTGGTSDKKSIDITRIDRILEGCLNDENNVSTTFQIQCIGQAYQKWDDGLNFYYKKTRAAYGKKAKAALLKAQRNWLKFRDAEVEFMSTMYNNLGGTLYQVIANDANMCLVKNRTRELAIMSMEGEDFDENVYNYVKTSFDIEYGIDSKLEICLQENESNLGTQDCLSEFAKRNDDALNKFYKKLRSRLNDDEKAKLKATQLKWLKFRDSELEIYNAIYEDMGGGSMYATEKVRTNAYLLLRRAEDLKDYFETITER